MEKLFTQEKSEKINHLVGRMKDLLRQGWVGKVPTSNIESLADHSFGVAVWTYILGTLEKELSPEIRESLSVEKAVVKALFHDMHEGLFLDIDRSIQTSLGEEGVIIKDEIEKKLEQKLVEIMTECLSQSSQEISKDLNSQEESLENDLVKLADKVDMIFQAKNYMKKGWLSEELGREFLKTEKFFSNSKLKIAEIIGEIIGNRT